MSQVEEKVLTRPESRGLKPEDNWQAIRGTARNYVCSTPAFQNCLLHFFCSEESLEGETVAEQVSRQTFHCEKVQDWMLPKKSWLQELDWFLLTFWGRNARP
jgi:hypothetical protein